MLTPTLSPSPRMNALWHCAEQLAESYTLAELLERRARSLATIKRLSGANRPEHWNTFDRDEMGAQAVIDERDLEALKLAYYRLGWLDKAIEAKRASEQMEVAA